MSRVLLQGCQQKLVLPITKTRLFLSMMGNAYLLVTSRKINRVLIEIVVIMKISFG